MAAELDESEVASLNAIITHAEHLITARGRFTDRLGLYEDDSFGIIFRRDDDLADLQITSDGETVMRVRWEETGSPGHVHAMAGPWRSKLLAVRAAHS